MPRIQTPLIAILILGAVATGRFGPTMASAQSRDQTQTMTDKAKTTVDDVSKWTQKQWNAAKAKWVKEKDKWNSCNKQAKDKKLHDRNSWSFIYTCMTG
jgi:hypothetical protein